MHQRHAVFRRPLGDDLWASSIDAECDLALVFSAVYGDLGRGVDDEIGLEDVELADKPFTLGHIKLRDARRNDRTEPCQEWLQCASDLAVGSCQQYPHQICP